MIAPTKSVRLGSSPRGPAPTVLAWRRRGSIVLAAACACLFTFIAYAGPSAPTALRLLATDGGLVLLWVLSAAGAGAWFSPSPGTPGEGRGGGSAQRTAGVTGSKLPVAPDPQPNPPPECQERGSHLLCFTTAAALGIGVMSLLLLGLGLVGWLNRTTAILLLVIGLAAGVLRIWQKPAARSPLQSVARWLAAPVDWVDWLWLLAMPLLTYALLAALVPPGLLWGDEPAAYDVMEYHLQVPREWYEAGRIQPLPHNAFSYMPFNVEVHYLWAMHVSGGPWAGMYACQLISVALIVLTVLAIYGIARSIAPKAAATAAALLAATTPWLLLLAPVAYNEAGMLLFATLAIGWAVRASPSRGVAAPLLAGLFAGFACGTKLTAVPVLLLGITLAMLTSGWLARERSSHLASRLAGFLLAALVALAPWLLRNVAWVGNPVFPEATRILGRGHFTDEQVQRWRRAHSPRSDQQTWSARGEAVRAQILADWRYGYALIPLGALAAVVCFAALSPPGIPAGGAPEDTKNEPTTTGRSTSAAMLVILLAALCIFWLFFTHLQSRFFVLAIPIASLLAAHMHTRILPWVALPLVLLNVGLALGPGDSIAAHGGHLPEGAGGDSMLRAAAPVLGSQEDLSQSLVPPEVGEAIAKAEAVYLVGDAQAFAYRIPMARLRYRTVFDVQAAQQPIELAWLGGPPAEGAAALVVVNPGELRRLAWKAETGTGYWGILLPPPQIDGLRPFARRWVPQAGQGEGAQNPPSRARGGQLGPASRSGR